MTSKTAAAPAASATLDFKGAERITALAAIVKKDFQIGEGGAVEVPKDLYEKNLPEGLTMADIKKVQEYNTDLVAGVGLALGEVGLDHFKKHKKETELSVGFQAGKDKIELNFARHKQFPNGQGGTIDRYGVLSARYQVAGAGNRGTFKKVRENLAERAASILAG